MKLVLAPFIKLLDKHPPFFECILTEATSINIKKFSGVDLAF